MPVRKIRANYRSVTGLVAVDQSARSTAYESSLERDFIRHLVFNKNVIEHEEQPLTIDFTEISGKRRRYTPDLLISYRKDDELTRDWQPLLAEVKYRSDLFKSWTELKPKFLAARAHARERNWEFAIITEQELRTPYLTNITFLLEFRKHSVDQVLTEVLLEAMARMSPATPARVLTFLTNDATQKATLLPTLWQMIANGYIGTDLEQRLTMSSLIWLSAPKEGRERDESTFRVRAGSSHRMRWQALRYYPHPESRRHYG
jgi:hypothetical protein